MAKKKEEDSQFLDASIEQQLVTALTIQPGYFGAVQKIFPHSSVFQDEPSRLVYETISDLHQEGAEIRSLAIFQRLRAVGKFSIVSKAGMSLREGPFIPSTSKEIIDTAEAVMSNYRRGLVNEFLYKLSTDLGSNKSDQELTDYVFKCYQALALSGNAKYEKTSREANDEALAQLEKNMQKYRSGGITGVPTGSKKIDDMTGGWQNDSVIVLAGRPAMGKTSCAIDFMLAAAQSGVPCGFISMEMGAKELKFRQWANYTNIPYSRMRKGEISNDELVRLQNAASEISKLPIWYIDDVDVKDIVKLTAVVSEWKRKYKLGMLFVDYIQYLESDEFRNYNDTQRINHVMKQVKTLNRNLEIPIMALAQLNRDTEARGNPRPSLADLKGSGQIEQDASIVIGLFNPMYYLRQGKKLYDEAEGEEAKVEFEENAYLYYFMKFRDGEIQRVDRYANLATCRFSDYRHMGKEQAATLSFEKSSSPEQQAHNFATNKIFDVVKPASSFSEGPELPFDINDIDTNEEPPF